MDPATGPRRRAVSVDLQAGETLGIVGESGLGKSTLLRLALRLERQARAKSCSRANIAALARNELKAVRRRMQAVFRIGLSFNPRQTVGRILLAPLEVHGSAPGPLAATGRRHAGAGRPQRRLLGAIRTSCRAASASRTIARHHPAAGPGRRRRTDLGARRFRQAQILNLFKQTRRELGLTYLFVSHNLGVIRYVSDRVAVMRLGQIVECGTAHEIFTSPQHDYTRALLAARPDVDLATRRAAE